MKRLFLLIVCALFISYQTPILAQKEVPQCAAITQKGQRYKNRAAKGSMYCNVHKAKDTKNQRCKAKTKAGKQCSRPATKAGYCTQHYNIYVLGK